MEQCRSCMFLGRNGRTRRCSLATSRRCTTIRAGESLPLIEDVFALNMSGTWIRDVFCNHLITRQLKSWRRGESEFCPPLIPRNLLILLNGRNDKNSEFAKVRYTAGTRDFAQRGDRLEKTSPTTPFLYSFRAGDGFSCCQCGDSGGW